MSTCVDGERLSTLDNLKNQLDLVIAHVKTMRREWCDGEYMTINYNFKILEAQLNFLTEMIKTLRGEYESR